MRTLIGIGLLVLGTGGMAHGVWRFRRTGRVSDAPMRWPWLGGGMRAPRENYSLRDLEDEGSSTEIVAGGLAILVGLYALLA